MNDDWRRIGYPMAMSVPLHMAVQMPMLLPHFLFSSRPFSCLPPYPIPSSDLFLSALPSESRKPQLSHLINYRNSLFCEFGLHFVSNLMGVTRTILTRVSWSRCLLPGFQPMFNYSIPTTRVISLPTTRVISIPTTRVPRRRPE